MKTTTIRIKTTTKQKLDKISIHKETYDDIINRLMTVQQ